MRFPGDHPGHPGPGGHVAPAPGAKRSRKAKAATEAKAEAVRSPTAVRGHYVPLGPAQILPGCAPPLCPRVRRNFLQNVPFYVPPGPSHPIPPRTVAIEGKPGPPKIDIPDGQNMRSCYFHLHCNERGPWGRLWSLLAGLGVVLGSSWGRQGLS